MLASNFDFEIKASRTNHAVPCVNGVHLHSVYNPIKEAETLIARYDKKIINSNSALVLGLGFGYHVNALANKMRITHGNNYRILVIEPSEMMYEECMRRGILDESIATIYAGEEISNLFSDELVVNFLLAKPVIVSHPASMSLYHKYFNNFLTYTAPKSLNFQTEYIKDLELKRHIEQRADTIILGQDREFSNKNDYILQALDFMKQDAMNGVINE